MTDPAPDPLAPEIAALQPIVPEREPSPPGDMSVIAIEPDRIKIDIQNLDFFYGKSQALKAISMSVALNSVTAMIGPSGCGKSTLLRTLNRMYGLYPGQKATGTIMFDGEDILGARVNLSLLRARIGMVFQKPTPFPMSIHDNVAFGVRLYESLSRADMHHRVEDSLRRAALWDEVKDKLHSSGLGLSVRRPLHRRAPGGAAAGRADFGPRSDLQRKARGDHHPAQVRLHHRDRHP
jgi:ABC-type multidrug transport system fused ATPase/permease subunit